MVQGPTIGVLTMSVGCDYFGGILGGIARTTAAAGGRMIAIQTLGAGTFDFDPPEPPDFRYPIAWDHVSAFIVILNSASVECLRAVRAAGKPVVMISDELPGFSCPVVLPDNKVGVKAAVSHLIDHGHRDIAFAGYTELRDLRERFEAYRDTLIDHGITPRDDLVFDTGDNRESGGERAARAMIAAGMPSTAVVAGNDLNAIGLVRALQAAEYDLPRQQAVVGFDDMDGVVYLTPSLSSVRQRFENLGRVAAELVLRDLAGEPVPAGSYLVPTSFVPRESCGCPDTLDLGALASTEDSGAISEADLVEQLTAVLAPTGTSFTRGERIAMSTAVVVGALRAVAAGAAVPQGFALREALASLHELGQRPECLVQTMRLIRRFGLGLAANLAGEDQAVADRVRSAAEDIVMALAQSRARARFRDGDEFLATLKMLYTVSKNLLRSHEKDPRGLGWIQNTPVRGGCLGLWASPPAGYADDDPVLEVVTTFHREQGLAPDTTHQISARSFPPAELVELADLDAEEMVYVAPLNIGAKDWGMLALVGPIQAHLATGGEMMNQWAALLTIALDHEAVLNSLREQEEMMRHAALYDPLTGLPNRTLFLDRLSRAVARHRRYPERDYAVLLLDLDGFKLVNDSLGHLAGDRLLVQVADRIQSTVREADVAARLGGDEFAILLTDIVDNGVAVAAANAIRASLAVPFRLGDEEVVVSCSIGISLSSSGYLDADDVIRDADTAMYSAKWQRKGSHAVFDVAMHAKAVGRLRTEAKLRKALDNEGFELHYQPIVCLETGVTRAFEALLRWRHPVRGLLSPNEFLLIAEESGLMPAVGRWVLAESCRQIGHWQLAGLGPDGIRVSVNVSNRQFWHSRLLDDVAESLSAANLDPSALIIEITEGVIIHDVRAARGKLAALHELGVGLYIDDFGTGYSSLEALHHLPIDAFKIDRSFVSPLATDPKSRELVRTIIAMGANLGLELVAEGIETKEQRDHLRNYGCHHGQGYLFSQPVPGDQAGRLLPSGGEAPAPRLAARAVT